MGQMIPSTTPKDHQSVIVKTWNYPDMFQGNDFVRNDGQVMSSKYSFPHATTQAVTKCPMRNGRWPKLDQCNQFIECIDSEPELMSCPSDMYYNPGTQECDLPDAVECPYKCAYENEDFPLFGHCSSFIQCHNGVPILMSCAKGLHWNPSRKRCVLPEDADCPVKCTTENETRPYIDDCQSYIYCENGIPRLRKCPSGLFYSFTSQICLPYQPGMCHLMFQCADVGRFPVWWDCERYLECSDLGSNAIVKHCPAEYLYNHYTEECDMANESICVNSCPAPDGMFSIPGLCNNYKVCTNDTSQLFMCPDGMHYNPVRQRCDLPSEAGCIPKCNGFGGVRGIPGKCNQYIECSHGVDEVKYCPGNLHFNQWLKTCDTPENAKCEFTCPQKNGFYPALGQCEYYYECWDGKATLKRCPSMLHFNARIKICDLPEGANCYHKCLEPDGIFPVDGDCSAFVICIHNVPSMKTCPPGYYFSAHASECHLAKNVDC